MFAWIVTRFYECDKLPYYVLYFANPQNTLVLFSENFMGYDGDMIIYNFCFHYTIQTSREP